MGREKFLNPALSIDSVDTYIIRTALLNAVKSRLPVLSGTLLDIGCGEMPYRELILEQSSVTRYIGLDIRNPSYQARRQPNLFWDGTTIPLAEASVDSVIATELFEHVPDLDIVLREIARVLTPGGTLFFTVPFLWPLHDSPWDFCRYTPFALRRHLDGAGLDVGDIAALGGWNASLAQMIGLWLNRSGLPRPDRARLFAELEPFYTQLVSSDKIPAGITDQMMSPGFQGLAVKRAPAAVSKTAARPRVVIVEEGFPSVSETFILNQITGLIDRGVNVDNWALQRLTPSPVHRQVADYSLIERTTYLTLPARDLRGDTIAWREEFRRRNPGVSLENIGAFHLHFGPTFVQLEPLFRDTDAFVLVSFHGYDASEVLKQRGAAYYTSLFTRANSITVPSVAMRDVLVEAGCPAGKLIVHRYGADPEPPAAAAPATGRVNLLTIGRMVEKKGIDDALRALARIPDRAGIAYRIVGEGPLRGAVERLIAELHLESCVTISDFVRHDDVAALLGGTDIFVLTSRTAANGDTEGLPVCLIEAQMAGVPVISTYHAGIPELVRDQETGLLCDERHVPQIAAAMATLIADPALRRQYGAAARAHALEHFNIERLNDRLAGILTTATAPVPSESSTPVPVEAPPIPLISVCIPTYNRAAFIGECLESVLAQADGRVEILVVDDGSTDGTEEIVRAFARPEIRYVRKAHTNGSDTRNTAVTEAAGDYILWVDSDDLLVPGALAAHRAALQAHPDGDVFYGNLKVFGDTRRLPAGEVLYDDYLGRNDYLLSRLVSHNRVPNGGTMLRKSLYARIGMYNPAFIRAHDYEFWCRAATTAVFVHTGAYTCLWRWHDSNMSSSSVEIDTSYEARILKQLMRDHSIEALFPFSNWDDRTSSLIAAYFQLAKAFVKWRDAREAWACVERAVNLIHPGWRMPKGTDAQKWQVVQLLVNETFAHDLQTRADFERGIAALGTRRAPAPAAFDRAFYDRKLLLLAAHLKTHAGDIATAEQLKRELLHPSLPRVTTSRSALVSVIIPFYQQADTLAATLASLSAQTYRAFEVVIVSDGDPDVPEAALDAFRRQNPDIRVDFELASHAGLAATRNRAIARANGTYILPLDSDDLLASIFLEKTVPVLEERPDLSVVYTETLFFGEKNEIWSHVDFDPTLLLHRNLMTCTSLFRRDMWTALGGYRVNMTHGYEDWDFWIGAVARGFRATNVHLPLFLYRRKKQSMLGNRPQFDRIAKAQIIANHPSVYHSLSNANRAALDSAAIGRIPDAFIRARMPAQPPAPARSASNARPRILFVCHDFPPYRYAGAQLYALNLAKELKRQGLADVDVLHPVFRERYDRFAITPGAFDGLNIYKLSKDITAGYDNSIHHQAVDTLLDRFLASHPYDAVHIHGLGQLSASPITVAKRHGVPAIMTLHDYWLLCAFWHLMTPDQRLCSGPDSTAKCAECYLKFGHPSPEDAPLTHDFMRKRASAFHEVFRQLDATVAPSRYLADTFTRFGFPGVQVSPLGMPPITPLPKMPHAGIVFGFVGQIIARKGVEVLLKAFADISRPDVLLEIWGTSTDEAYLDRIVGQIAGMPNVRYKGGYAPAQLPGIFAELDVAVVPSFMENYPLVVQEAFMNNTPVIASRAGGIPEVVAHGRNGLLFDTGSAGDLALQLNTMIDNPAMITVLGANIPPARTIADDAAFYAAMYGNLAATACAGAGDLRQAQPIGVW